MQKQINQLILLPFWPKIGWVIFLPIFGTFSLTTTIPDFRFYALADGIRELLFSRKKGLEGFSQMLNTESMQLSLFDP
jgi:hypothetical protein